MSKNDQNRRPDELGGTNTPQHAAGGYGGPEHRRAEGLPTGSGTGPGDVADPHPANEEHYDRQRRPGGAKPSSDPIGPNDAAHDGTAARRPPPRRGAPG